MDERMHKIKNILISISIFLILATLVNGEVPETNFFILLDICRNNSAMVKEYGIQRVGDVIYEEGRGNYSIVFLSTENKILLTYRFDVGFVLHASEIDPITGEIGEKIVELECAERYFRLPYFENIKKMRILYLNVPIYEMEICNYNNRCEENLGENAANCIDCNICGNKVCEFGENQTTCCIDCGCPQGFTCKENKCLEDKCGNNVCESFFPYNENYKTCPKDCPSGSKDNYCDAIVDRKCDPDCRVGEDIDCIKPDLRLIYFVAGGIIIFVILVIIYILYKSKK